MESSQLKRISIVGISILCLSPLDIFSNKLFENKGENKEKSVILATSDLNVNSTYLSNNYEIFNPNIKKTSEELNTLVEENKKKEISKKIENKELESKNSEEKTDTNTNQDTKKVVTQQEKKVTVNKSVSTNKNTVKTAKKETTKKQTTKKKTTKVQTTKKETEKKVVTEKKVEQNNNVSSNKNTATNLVNYAKQFVGNPYKYGGTSLTNGVDCSGFTMKIYEKYGYKLPHSAASQASYGSYVSTNNLQPGDLIFYGYNGSISHVAIYIGNSQIVHAATSNSGIKIANYNIMPIITARRILKNS